MPHRGEVGRVYWCPGWWPWEWGRICADVVAGWCYRFSFYKEYRQGVAVTIVACEQGTLYSWTEFGIGFGEDTYYNVTRCYREERPKTGECESFFVGTSRSRFIPSNEPFVSTLVESRENLRSDVGEVGTFTFTPEHNLVCKIGQWPYRRVFHQQMITASIAINALDIQWRIGGIPLAAATGTLSMSVLCKLPFPLPHGRTMNRAAQVKYEVVTRDNTSTLMAYNDPADGCYSFPIGLVASQNAREYSNQEFDAAFEGETCDFDRQQLEQFAGCVRRELVKKLKDRYEVPSLIMTRPPRPNFTVPDELWLFVPTEKRELVEALYGLAVVAISDDPVLSAQTINALEYETGVSDIGRRIGPTGLKSRN